MRFQAFFLIFCSISNWRKGGGRRPPSAPTEYATGLFKQKMSAIIQVNVPIISLFCQNPKINQVKNIFYKSCWKFNILWCYFLSIWTKSQKWGFQSQKTIFWKGTSMNHLVTFVHTYKLMLQILSMFNLTKSEWICNWYHYLDIMPPRPTVPLDEMSL